MKSHLCIVAAAALAVGSIGISKTYAEDPNNPKPTVGQRIENGTEKTERALGIKKEPGAYQTEHAAAIEKILSEVTDAALTKSGLDDMAERFVDADRVRLNQNKDAFKDDQLDGRIAEFQKDWKAKYNQDFDVKSQYDKVFDQSFAMITEGEELGAKTASGKVNSDSAGNTPDKVNANNQTGIDKPGSDDANKNLNDKGRNIATVHIAASHGMPALDVPMIHEAGGWKIDIPDSVDTTKFRDNVRNALTKCDEMKDKWSPDVTEAYRAVTHSVLLATFDKPLTDEAQKASGTIPPDQGTNPNPNANPASPQPIQPVQPAK